MHKNRIPLFYTFLVVSLLGWIPENGFAQAEDTPFLRYQNGKLVDTPDSLGNRVPDFSYSGYQSSDSALPTVPIVAVIKPLQEDATATFQAAIDYTASLPLQSNGFRGAILIREGTYVLKGRLEIRASGIVIRGESPNTILMAAGPDRETLIRVAGLDDRQISAANVISDQYVPVGAANFHLENTADFAAGDLIQIKRPSTKEWISELGMDDMGGENGWISWKPGQRDVIWEREIKQIAGNEIQLDAPLTIALDKQYGEATVAKLQWPGRIENIGIENLSLRSAYASDNPKDEDHCWNAVSFENVQNAWARNLQFEHFAGSAVAVFETGSRITVQDCIAKNPISEIAGERRNTFFTEGQLTLFIRCYSEYGMHDFSAGFIAAGPNAFVQCAAYLPFSYSGSIDSWASGLLFDNVQIDGHAIRFGNLDIARQGAGWNAANSMIWQSAASKIDCYSPPMAQNWAYGVWGQLSGNGHWYEANSQVTPRSLFLAQLENRTGKSSEQALLEYQGVSTSRPSLEEAAEATRYAALEAPDLRILIQNQVFPPSSQEEIARAKVIAPVLESKIQANSRFPEVELTNGWLALGIQVLNGKQLEVPWWRGDDRPYELKQARPAITRFVPGQKGLGYTDCIPDVVTFMQENGYALLDHNYGLWYDRRRDDHERIRRIDPDTWAPFYEQPFARSGQGEAWDRLSQYDLRKYNIWYWNRLQAFAAAGVHHGKLLLHQNYFQHNILEAGAHWVDSPWRPANNINQTGFPEPPNFADDKRIFFAEQFYDITHPERRELHRAYIRQGLDQLKDYSNVLQSISAEFTGPRHFVEFWLDVIAEWKLENKTKNHICLAATKDVQDAILNNPKYAALIDVIDIRYWAYREDGSLYAPPGGAHVAPRQHARLESPGKRSFASVYRSVSEYKSKFPEKAVLYSENRDPHFAWAVFMAGGSVSALPATLPQQFLKCAGGLQPDFAEDQTGVYLLKNETGETIIYLEPGKSVQRNGALVADYFYASGAKIKSERRRHKKAIFKYRNDTGQPVVICLHNNDWNDQN